MSQSSSLVDAAYLKRERLSVTIYIVAVALTVSRIVHDAWVAKRAEFAHPTSSTKLYYLFRPTPPPLHAPEAYRVGVVALGELLMKILHIGDPTVMAALLTFCFASAALWLSYQLAVDGLSVRTSKAERALTTVFFLAFAYFPMTWEVPWQRPETQPTAFYLAFALLCLSRGRRSGVWTLLLMVATIWQGFVRADVARCWGLRCC